MQPLAFNTLLSATRGAMASRQKPPAEINGISIDSRTIQPGELFWALRGERLDGHDYVAAALQQGAAAAVVSEEWAARQLLPKAALVTVPDTLQALWDLARWRRRQSDALLIGVTGSVGKTTTRRMLQTVLSQRFAGIESPANFNNHIGVPLSLLQLEPTHEFAVLEAGASHVGEIARLAALMEPEIGVLTAIAPAHLEGFESLEGICRAKGELLEALPPSGLAVLNGDDPLVRRLARRASCRVILVGEEIHNDVVGTKIRVNDRRLRFQVGETEFQLPVIGRHHLTSALLAVAVAREIDLSDSEISAGLKAFTAVEGRCQKLVIGPWTVIDDTYNASPASMVAACQTLQDWQDARRRILVVGDMLELGPHAQEFHRQLGELAAECRFDRVIAVGAQAAAVAGAARQQGVDAGCLGDCPQLDAALLLLDCWLEPGDVILVKGSRGMRMERVIEHLKGRAAAEFSSSTPIAVPRAA